MGLNCEEFDIVTSRLIQTVSLASADAEEKVEDDGTTLNTKLEIY